MIATQDHHTGDTLIIDHCLQSLKRWMQILKSLQLIHHPGEHAKLKVAVRVVRPERPFVDATKFGICKEWIRIAHQVAERHDPEHAHERVEWFNLELASETRRAGMGRNAAESRLN